MTKLSQQPDEHGMAMIFLSAVTSATNFLFVFGTVASLLLYGHIAGCAGMGSVPLPSHITNYMSKTYNFVF
ncbi:hypothetical protein O9992_08075 [Vibrio lentus]|nr:hypothetical protein [Vibrio lentus]